MPPEHSTPAVSTGRWIGTGRRIYSTRTTATQKRQLRPRVLTQMDASRVDHRMYCPRTSAGQSRGRRCRRLRGGKGAGSLCGGGRKRLSRGDDSGSRTSDMDGMKIDEELDVGLEGDGSLCTLRPLSHRGPLSVMIHSRSMSRCIHSTPVLAASSSICSRRHMSLKGQINYKSLRINNRVFTHFDACSPWWRNRGVCDMG